MKPITCKYLIYVMFNIYILIGKLKMKFIYLKNYLDLPREEKLNFFKFLGNAKNLSLSNQRMIFGENALLLDFNDNTNIEEAKKTIEGFFKTIPKISVYIVNQIIDDKDSLILEFNNKKLRVKQ